MTKDPGLDGFTYDFSQICLQLMQIFLKVFQQLKRKKYFQAYFKCPG